MIFLYILAAIAISQGLITLMDGIWAARHMRTFRPQTIRRDRVIVFCPCKGIDPEFDQNIRSILDQDYPNFEARFVVESEDDPAYGRLRQLGIRDVLVAGYASDRGQKVHNLAYAVSHVRATAGIYVFCDSDARFDRRWLSRLIAPLDGMNVTTGYRWYVVERLHWPSLLRSAWNASVVSMLGDHTRNFAWGGSMAMARSMFEQLRILDAWRGSVSDDYAVTRAVEASGGRIVFVPECLVPSYGECGWRELFEFTTRQITITRVYYPRLWRIGFLAQVIFTSAFVSLPFTHPMLWLILYGLSSAKAWVRLRAARSVLPATNLLRFAWFYILFSPLIALLYLYNMVRSALSADIVWREKRYRLVSPNQTCLL